MQIEQLEQKGMFRQAHVSGSRKMNETGGEAEACVKKADILTGSVPVPQTVTYERPVQEQETVFEEIKSSAAGKSMSVRGARYLEDTRDDSCVILVRNTNCEQNWQTGMHLLDFLIHSPSSGSNGAAIGTIPSSNSLNLLSVASTATPTTKDTTEKETIDTTGIEVNNEKKTSSINV